MEWWKVKTEDLNEEQAEAKRLAYYNTFFGSPEGRQVLLDLQRESYKLWPVGSAPSSDAVIARIDFLQEIRANCGANVESEMAAIEAEGKTI